MDEDPLLKKGASAESEKTDPIKEGLLIVGFDEKAILYLGETFQKIFDANSSSRNGLSMLRGALHSLGSQKNDPEWREHCAGSLRELIHECRSPGQISTWFCKAFKTKNSNFPNITSHSNDYAQIDRFYGYFSEIHHHNSLYILQRLRLIYGDQIKAGDDSKETFIKAVKDFLEKLHSFFLEHVKNI